MKPKQITVDLHGMTTQQAKRHLEQLLRTLPDQVEQITVVHGFHRGDALQQMVRGKGLSSKRIKQKILSMNPGETILLLSPKPKKNG